MMKNKPLMNYGKILLPRKTWLLAIVTFLTFSYSVTAQEVTVTGTVKSENDKTALPGVNVQVKGSRMGIMTDLDGGYSIKANATDVLVFSYIGYADQEIPVGNNTLLNVSLKETTNSLDEVVVVGYGTQRKSDLTGAVSVVNVKDAKKTITYDVAKMLQGQAPGVTVQSSGEPGGFVSIKIRGVTSFVNNNPLFVIDGMIVDNPFDFAPGEIESMQVLKDASSSAIYGVRGANGVVIITTKKGKAGGTNVSFKSMFGTQTVAKRWNLMDRVGYQTVANAAETNAGIALAPGNDPSNPLYINNVDTDWQEEAFRNGSVENSAVTFSGGAENLNYSFNVDYFKNTSYVQTSPAYKRLSTTLNVTGTKGKFKYGGKLGYTQSDKAAFNEYLPGQSAIGELLLAIPTIPVYDPNRLGGYGGADNLTQRAISLNVIGFNNLQTNNNRRNRFIGNVWGELEILKGLKYKVNATADVTNSNIEHFNPPSDLGWYYITTNEEALLEVTRNSSTRTILDNLLTYELEVNKHKFDVLVGMIQEKNVFDQIYSIGVGYEPGEITNIQNSDDISTLQLKQTTVNISYLSRFNYAFDDRYLLQANFRRDKTSYFAPDNNTGDFYSFSGGWKISSEKFLKMPSWISLLKLRGGYGKLGNNTVGPYAYTSTTNPFASYAFGNTLAPGTTVVTLRDKDLVWETTKTTNVGLDLNLFNDKLQFSAEYFVKKTDDLLVRLPLPLSTGSTPSFIDTNSAAVENVGTEFSLTYNNNDRPFKYTISANFGTLRNEVTKIGNNDDPISSGLTSRTQVGRSIGELFAYQAIGIFQSQAEIDASPTQTGAAPGDVKFQDTDGNGIINADDRTFQGNTIPKYSYGLNFNCSYKNVDFSFFWQGVGGNYIYNNVYRNLMNGQYQNGSTDMLNYWTPGNTTTDVPRPVIGDPNANGRNSSRFIERGDYVKLQNVQLGYTLPLNANKYVKRARVYVSGQNLATITKYKGFDPDFLSGDSLLTRGEETGSYPNPRTFAMGVEIDF